LLIALKSKDEEILKLKLKVKHIKNLEKINSDLKSQNKSLESKIRDQDARELALVKRYAKLEASNVRKKFISLNLEKN